MSSDRRKQESEKRPRGSLGFRGTLITGIIIWTILSMILGVVEVLILFTKRPEDIEFVRLSMAVLLYGLPGLLGGLAWGFLSGLISRVWRMEKSYPQSLSSSASAWLGFLLLFFLSLKIHQGFLLDLKGWKFFLFFLLILFPLSLLISAFTFKLLKRVFRSSAASFFIQKRGAITILSLLFVIFLSSLFSPEISAIIFEAKFVLSRPFGDEKVPLEDRPNIVLIVLDTVREDRLSCYGYPKKITPHIDKLAQKGVLFENAYSTSCWTLPAHASLFTGNYPSKTGVLGGFNVLGDHNITLAEILKKEKHITLGVTANSLVSEIFGYSQGFYIFDDINSGLRNTLFFLRHCLFYSLLQNEPRVRPLVKFFTGTITSWIIEEHFGGSELAAERVNERVFHWIDRIPHDRPFFLFINYIDAHSPYEPPHSLVQQSGHTYNGWIKGLKGSDMMDALKKIAEKLQSGDPTTRSDVSYFSDLYDGEIRYLDQKVGDLLKGLEEQGFMESTLLIITSDHGEHFGEHNLMEHRNSLYEELLRIPLIIYYPGYISHMTIPVAVSLCDVPATILHLLQIPIPEGIQGRSLLSLLGGNEYNGQIFAEWEEDKMILKRGWKFIQSSSLGREKLYNLLIDQGEEVNLVSEEKDVAMELKESLSRWMESFEPQAVLESKVEMNETQKEHLRALGYID